MGLAITVLMDKRMQEFEKYKLDEVRFRRLNWYSCQMLDLNGRTPSDLYPLPWEQESRPKIDKDLAAMAAIELQKRLKGEKPRKMVKDGIAKTFR